MLESGVDQAIGVRSRVFHRDAVKLCETRQQVRDFSSVNLSTRLADKARKIFDHSNIGREISRDGPKTYLLLAIGFPLRWRERRFVLMFRRATSVTELIRLLLASSTLSLKRFCRPSSESS